jgi:two-component system sensor histidine kinase KdpD
MKRALRLAGSVLGVAAVIGLYRFLPVNSTTVALSLLLAILFLSAQWGLAEAAVASVVATVGLDYYFLPPVGTLTMEPQSWVALLAFLATAFTASKLSASARGREAEADSRRVEIERLYALVQAMMLTGGASRTMREFVHRVVREFGSTAAAFYYQATGEVVRSGPESEVATDHDLRVAAELDGVRIDNGRGLALAPVRLGRRPLGSLAMIGPLPSAQTIQAIADLVALTIEKARALEEAGHAEAARQSEAFRSAMLDALAHDIKTPLTAIKAAVTSLLGTAPANERELLSIIHESADRLNRMSAEVMAMARVEAGKLHLETRPVPVGELLASVLSELAPRLSGRPVSTRVADQLPAALVDPELIRQALKQLVENAANYSPPGSEIALSAEGKSAKILIRVADRGPGIQENERILIFDKFFRGRQHRYGTKGTGMGLAIAKGIVEAHGERIWVESEQGQGAVFSFTLPASPEVRQP